MASLPRALCRFRTLILLGLAPFFQKNVSYDDGTSHSNSRACYYDNFYLVSYLYDGMVLRDSSV